MQQNAPNNLNMDSDRREALEGIELEASIRELPLRLQVKGSTLKRPRDGGQAQQAAPEMITERLSTVQQQVAAQAAGPTRFFS